MLSVAEPIDSYEQYQGKQSLTVITENGLPGIPVSQNGNHTDANGQQWISDEIDYERGVYVQRVGQITLANDRTYYYNTDTSGKEFFYTANGTNIKAWETRMYCSHFPIIGGSVSMESDYWMQFSGSGGIRFRHKDLTSLNELATWLDENPVHICYVLMTPIETPLTDEELTYFKRLKTHYHNTTVMNDSGAHMTIKYAADTKMFYSTQVEAAVNAYLKANPGLAVPTSSIGTVELLASKWTTSSTNLYSQVVNVAGVTENSQVDLTPSVEQLVVFYEKDLTFVTENDGGTVTVYAIGQKPTNDYVIQVTITEVSA